MKRKRIWCLAVAAAVLCGSAGPAYAKEDTEKMQVKFTGDRVESNFGSGAVSEAIRILQPGDGTTISIALQNSDPQEATDWYMTNQAFVNLEENGGGAAGGAYTYRLSYRDSKDVETVLYSSETVGGRESAGLREATENMDEFFYLGRLGAGESGTVVLQVALEGESQGNAYQGALADLEMNFAVDKVGRTSGSGGGGSSAGKTPEGSGSGQTSEPARTPSSGAYRLHGVKTGDPSNMLLWAELALVSGIGLLALAVVYVKKEKGGNGREQDL